MSVAAGVDLLRSGPSYGVRVATGDKRMFGPTRGELWFRLAFSLVGLCLMLAAIRYRGAPQGIALVEVIGIAGAFFGGTAIWSAWKLWRSR